MNILITRHDKIGDFVLTLPMIKLAKNNIKNVRIILLVSKVNFEFAKELEFVDDVILYEDDILKLAKKIKKAKIDVSISAFIDTKLGLALFLSGIKQRVAPATKIAQIFFNKRLKQRRSRVEKREFEYNIDLLKYLYPNVKSYFSRPVINMDKKRQKLIFDEFKARYKIDENKQIICFHPGFGGSSDGNLKIEDYVRLYRSIASKNIQIVFSFGPDDKKSLEYIKKYCGNSVVCLDSKYSLIDFCYLISNFKIFVSTSTGPMHLAGAVNITTFSFFGSSLFASAKRWGSINEPSKQNNFSINKDYLEEDYIKIEQEFKKLVSEIESE
ncbi:glycosyltransferase, family 9 [Campylobacter blaseri]|uniref:Heptosyltransferase n=2 Tax=Campylobacter blaseri TaxID=2042961 RepID=A0A2P8QZQ2_9BACT|nr:glycosyltransferase family 9 protein [Campylobacter blaseri]PSM51721.1 heptosyltransferase [Campylobacter blaseri]PSM53512.1 heptosyltransferase [Campylobacter blaseri]QKF86319.1 glycosyltransferase, family 9 [Campylobacter blaseri]